MPWISRVIPGTLRVTGLPVHDMKLHEDGMLNVILDELDAGVREGPVVSVTGCQSACQRRQERHPFRAACLVRFFPLGTFVTAVLPGRTRNLSRSGEGLLVRRVFGPNEPIELAVQVPNKPVMFIGGLATFFRYARRGYHEVGLLMHAAGPHAIFSEAPFTAMQSLEWLRHAPATT